MNMQTQIKAERAVKWIKSDRLASLPYETRVHVRFAGGFEDANATFAGFWVDHCRAARDGHGARRAHVTHYRLAEDNLSGAAFHNGRFGG